MYDPRLADLYVSAVAKEIASFSRVNARVAVDTIYFGGGTPSLLLPDQLRVLLEAVQTRFDVSTTAEVTMEMNPGTVTPQLLDDFRRLGINRASFGAQSFNDRELARLGRSHNADDTRRTFRLLCDAGFDNVSFDLIAGLPGQTLEGWGRNVDETFSLRPEHLSFYLLEVHEGTPLADHIRKGIQPKPDEDLAAEMYSLMLDRAAEVGYEHYEISNLSLPGFESRHNTKYWTGEPYYGFGCSAHSYDGSSVRWSNQRDLSQYIAMLQDDSSPVVTSSELSEHDRQAESVFLGLRMMNGINMSDYAHAYGIDLRVNHEEDLARFSDAGLVVLDGDHLKLTRAGALLSNEVFAAFV
jgi:oxygen-independent coproporphyrinogen-3 oxidase